MLVLGFGNKARAGKDTAVEAIVGYFDKSLQLAHKHGLKNHIPVAQSFKFAGALYEECQTLHGMKEKDAPLLQRVGMQRRAEDPFYWIERCFQKIRDEKPDIALISDVRFLNEAKWIKDIGGYTINVSRLNEDGTKFVADDRPADHPSETELDDWNWDYRLTAKTGQCALVGELAITLVEFIRGLRS